METSSVVRTNKGKRWFIDLEENKYGSYVRISNPFTNYTVNAETKKVHRHAGVYRDMPKVVWNKVLELLAK
jgi:hypothetical protein